MRVHFKEWGNNREWFVESSNIVDDFVRIKLSISSVTIARLQKGYTCITHMYVQHLHKLTPLPELSKIPSRKYFTDHLVTDTVFALLQELYHSTPSNLPPALKNNSPLLTFFHLIQLTIMVEPSNTLIYVQMGGN